MTPIQFDSIGGKWVNPPLLMPASIPLELSGEAVRSRLITSSDLPDGEYALRPDLTLAIALQHIEQRQSGPISYRYFGKAFRQSVNAGDPIEFNQTGFECFGHADKMAQDEDTISAICQAISETGLKNIKLKLGNVSLFTDLIAALGVSKRSKDRLVRAFRRDGGLSSAFEAEPQSSSAISTALKGMDDTQALAFLDEIIGLTAGAELAGRSHEDILARLRHKNIDQVEDFSPETRNMLLSAVALDGEPDAIIDQLAKLTRGAGIDLGTSLERQSQFIARLRQKQLPYLQDAQFSIGFGRRFEYYDGLVFELHHEGFPPQKAIAAGGRYDGLIKKLSQNRLTAHAVGGVVRPDRLEDALRLEGDRS